MTSHLTSQRPGIGRKQQYLFLSPRLKFVGSLVLSRSGWGPANRRVERRHDALLRLCFVVLLCWAFGPDLTRDLTVGRWVDITRELA